MTMSESRLEDAAAARLAAGVASYALGVPQDEIMRGKRGCAEAAFARQVAMYLCHVGFEFSLARVAAAFGRDRSRWPMLAMPSRIAAMSRTSTSGSAGLKALCAKRRR